MFVTESVGHAQWNPCKTLYSSRSECFQADGHLQMMGVPCPFLVLSYVHFFYLSVLKLYSLEQTANHM